MSTYTKEKNLIIFALDGTKGTYKLDINTGIFYGIKGAPIKSCPRRNEIVRLLPYYHTDNSNNLSYVLHAMFNNHYNTAIYVEYVEAMQAADKIDAIGINPLCLGKDQYAYLGKHIKALAAYIKEHDDFRYREFTMWCEFEEAKKELGALADLLTAEMYDGIKRIGVDLSKEELSVCAYYLGRGKYWEYHRGSVDRLAEYIRMCRKMGMAPQKVNNFMREYCETKKTYELRRAEYDNKQIAINYAKHSKAWEFAYGDYVIVIPTSGQDIIDEGAKMHHCVGSYVDNVVRNDTYICFVRHKDTPDIPYITCQVYTNGNIGQYFLAYDRYISDEKDKAFKEAFANHLRQVWEEN